MTIIFAWIPIISPSQIEQLFDVFLSAFLPQKRANREQLSNYFNNKIIPRLESGQLIYTVSDKNRIVGFALFEKWEEGCYYLAEMALSPQYQRQGLGKKLVFSIFDKDRAAEKILLVTEKENALAQSFYEKIGFKHSSFQHPDYPENFIGFVLTKD